MWGLRDSDPLISWGQIKLETSNLAERWIAVSTKEKNAKLAHSFHVWSCHLPLSFRHPSNIPWTNKATKFKFGPEMDSSEY